MSCHFSASKGASSCAFFLDVRPFLVRARFVAILFEIFRQHVRWNKCRAGLFVYLSQGEWAEERTSGWRVEGEVVNAGKYKFNPESMSSMYSIWSHALILVPAFLAATTGVFYYGDGRSTTYQSQCLWRSYSKGTIISYPSLRDLSCLDMPRRATFAATELTGLHLPDDDGDDDQEFDRFSPHDHSELKGAKLAPFILGRLLNSYLSDREQKLLKKLGLSFFVFGLINNGKCTLRFNRHMLKTKLPQSSMWLFCQQPWTWCRHQRPKALSPFAT